MMFPIVYVFFCPLVGWFYPKVAYHARTPTPQGFPNREVTVGINLAKEHSQLRRSRGRTCYGRRFAAM